MKNYRPNTNSRSEMFKNKHTNHFQMSKLCWISFKSLDCIGLVNLIEYYDVICICLLTYLTENPEKHSFLIWFTTPGHKQNLHWSKKKHQHTNNNNDDEVDPCSFFWISKLHKCSYTKRCTGLFQVIHKASFYLFTSLLSTVKEGLQNNSDNFTSSVHQILLFRKSKDLLNTSNRIR